MHPRGSKEKDTIYVANISTYRSSDGGKQFTAIKGAPGGDDYHTVWINPENPRNHRSCGRPGSDDQREWRQTWSSWYNQPTAQFYHVITDNQFPYWVYGGQQESGSDWHFASRSDCGAITFRDWYPVGVEEYGYVAPDPLDPNIIYGGKVDAIQPPDRTDAGRLSGCSANWTISLQSHRAIDFFTSRSAHLVSWFECLVQDDRWREQLANR